MALHPQLAEDAEHIMEDVAVARHSRGPLLGYSRIGLSLRGNTILITILIASTKGKPSGEQQHRE